TMKCVDCRLSANTVAPGVEGPAVEAALHFLADVDVLLLDLMRDGDTLLDLLICLVASVWFEEVVEEHLAAIRSQRPNDVYVHVAVVDVEHHVGKDMTVIGVFARPHLADRLRLRRNCRFEGADLAAGEWSQLGAISSVIQDARQPGMDRVN